MKKEEAARKEDSKIVDLHKSKIDKKILEQTAPENRDAIRDFLKKYKDDTLTGI